MINFIASDPRVNLISLAVTVLSVVVTVVIYLRSKIIKIPCYSRIGRVLISPDLIEHNPIGVTFRGTPIETLTLTHIAFWNDGRATLSAEDIAGTDPLRIIAAEGCDILASDIVCKNRPANNFRLDFREQDNIVYLHFDFIDYKDGVIIRVYHTGSASQAIDIVGTIKGTKGILNADRADEGLFSIMDRVDKWFRGRYFRLLPKRLLNLLSEVEARQNFVLTFLAFLPLMVLFGPFILIYMTAMVLLTFASVLGFFFAKRYSVPKELYSMMRFG